MSSNVPGVSTLPAQPRPPTLPAAPCDCDTDPVEALKRLFVDYFQGRGIVAGRDPASRPVFLRQHGLAHGVFEVQKDLPAELRIGVFAQATAYPAWVRFSSDVQPGVPDLNGTMGIAIKLFGVEGTKMLERDADAPTHDFLLQNHDVFFVDNARDMCEFTCESLHGRGDAYLETHPATQRILADMTKAVPSALRSPYWSIVPFRFGEGRAVKYKIEPEACEAGPEPDLGNPTYLHDDLALRLKAGEARFRFLLQFQTNDADMPLDQATARWSEDASAPIHVATLVLPAQDIDSRGQAAYGEHLAFNIWRALVTHAPLGSLALARKSAYQASADRRRHVNGIPSAEPSIPRPPEYEAGVAYPDAKDRRIVRVAIHPAIGVARVGNSVDQYFIGPQVVEPAQQAPGFYRDGSGALKRQAAEFRLYGYNAAGQVVREVTADWASIRWTAHLANHKAAWYQWQMALDVPEAAALASPLRNPKHTTTNARKVLQIDGGKRTVSGKNARGAEFNGEFTGQAVYLGEMRTDAVGRLLILPGLGKSASPTGAPVYVATDPNPFGNSDGWYDDVADGPVTAIVEIDGRTIEAEPAWVVTAPPNYAPHVKGLRTLYDLLQDVFVQAGWLPAPSIVSYRQDVYPLLQRLSGLQWVNEGFATQFGHQSRYDFDDPTFAAQLGRNPTPKAESPAKEIRRQIFNSFRPPSPADGNPLPWPWLYGDAMELPASSSPRQNATLSTLQYQTLRRWVEGDFIDDWDRPETLPDDIAAVALAEQPAMLDRAALEFCLADAFHPGCEVTWPIRHLSMFNKPFRIRHRPQGVDERPLPRRLSPEVALAPDGPLFDQGPGGLTRWMAVPWQADTAWCRAGYVQGYDPFVPSFWPARVPNQVLSATQYAVVVDATQSPEHRNEAFLQRTNWNAPLGDDTQGAMEKMVKLFGSMGLVEPRAGVAGDANLPASMQVASYGPDIAPSDSQSGAAAAHPAAAGAALLAAGAQLPDTAIDAGPSRPPSSANFSSQEAADAAPRPVRHTDR
jgi:hypothetical protein